MFVFVFFVGVTLLASSEPGPSRHGEPEPSDMNHHPMAAISPLSFLQPYLRPIISPITSDDDEDIIVLAYHPTVANSSGQQEDYDLSMYLGPPNSLVSPALFLCPIVFLIPFS